MAPVFEEGLRAEIFRGEEVVATVALWLEEDSVGLHQGSCGPFAKPGLYRVRLLSDEVARLEGEPRVEVGFKVLGARGPIKAADSPLNLPLLQSLA